MGFSKWIIPEPDELLEMIKKEPDAVIKNAKSDALLGSCESHEILNKFLNKAKKRKRHNNN